MAAAYKEGIKVTFRAGRLIINGTDTPIPTWSLTVAVNSYIRLHRIYSLFRLSVECSAVWWTV
jgi:hypothetical protein